MALTTDLNGIRTLSNLDIDGSITVPADEWRALPWRHPGRGAQGTRLTAAEPGIHLVIARVVWEAGGTGNRWIRVLRNGSENAAQVQRPSMDHGTPEHQIVALVTLLAGDTVSIEVHHDSRDRIDVLGDTRLSMVRL